MENFIIKEIRIKGLFGHIDHEIPLKSGGVTFMHGPNGCGKTTSLRLISAFFNWEINNLFEINFSNIEIEKNNKEILLITKKNKIKSRDVEISFKIKGRKNTKAYVIDQTNPTFNTNISPADIEVMFPFLTRVGIDEWIDKYRGGRRFDFSEIYHIYVLPAQKGKKTKRPDWLLKFIDSVKLHFIKTQRLLKVDSQSLKRHRPEETNVPTVIQSYSEEIKKLIKSKLEEQGAMSQTFDRSFPKRVLSLNNDDTVSETEIRKLYTETENKMQKLVEAGLMEQQDNISLPKKKLEDIERRVLSLYLKDVNAKLAILDDLQSKIETLLEVINPKFKTKKLTVNREQGFKISLLNGEKEKLSPTQLSSGEQHQIVLFYELIFKDPDNSFFLIDEPEISLHVDWQRMFYDDIHKIAKLGDRHFLIATHSPQIIGSYRNLAVKLNEGILD